jgi:hypothetical protein
VRMLKPFFFILLACAAVAAQTGGDWHFAVSGDSRNCGDVIMPAIAQGAKQNDAAFYWHLGDLRAIYGPDEDYKAEPEHRGKPVDKNSYLRDAWPDFIHNQIGPFEPLPFFVGIGNHETTSPKTRSEFVTQFAQWLNAPPLKKQRQSDGDKGGPRTYYHWIQGGVDFIYLDNATQDQFDYKQLKWLESVLKGDSANPQVRSIVAGMHVALPESLASSHSMDDWSNGVSSGQRAYQDLLNFNQKSQKPVYVLASHSHFLMSGIYDTDYWRSHGGVLPGWIVGTAGAVRYALPDTKDRAKEARTKVYGYLLGTVHANGAIDFKFEEIKRGDIPDAVNQRFTPEFVDYCFNQNTAFNNSPTR